MKAMLLFAVGIVVNMLLNTSLVGNTLESIIVIGLHS
jgi:hypothetical protein